MRRAKRMVLGFLMPACVASGWAVPLRGEHADPRLAREGVDSAIRLSLAEAVERALAASPALRQAQALEASAAAEVRLARAARRPQLELSLGYTRNSDVPELAIPQAAGPPRVIFPNIPDNGRARLGAALPLYTGGKLSALIAAGEDEREATRRDGLRQREDAVLETRQAYWWLVTAREGARVLVEAVRGYEAHLADARNREAVGLAARNEVLAVQVERDRAELMRLRAENAAAAAEANVLRLLGLQEVAVRIEPTEPLDGPAAEGLDLVGLVARALEQRPERAALVARLSAAEARTRAEGAARLPQVTAAAGYDYANPNRRILPMEALWRESWDAGVSLSWNVFDGGRTSAAMARARARADAMRAQLDDVTRRIRLDVTQRFLEAQAAHAAVGVSARHLEAARENQRVAADRYREGLIASSELLDAEVALQRAGLDRVETLAAVQLAAASLERALGR